MLDTLSPLIQAQGMTVLFATSILYWIAFALSLVQATKLGKLYRWSAILERTALLIFTAGLVLYIYKLEVVNGQIQPRNTYDKPMSWLLFAWSLNAAHLATEIAYANRFTAIFTNLWTALALTIAPGLGSLFKDIFTNDLLWLNFHRLCFLLGYAFCLLAFPLAIRFFWVSRKLKKIELEKRSAVERDLWKIDRMAYRMILLALPLLTAGIVTETLILFETHQLPNPLELWMDRKQTLMALAAWFICGIYLHTRLFFGWKNKRACSLYLVGLIILLVGQFGDSLLFLQGK